MTDKYPIASLATEIGHVTIEWNEIHFYVFDIFVELVGSYIRASAIFFSLQSDRAQRDATAALAKTIYVPTDELSKQITTVLNRISAAAFRRNDLIHAMWEIDHAEQLASVMSISKPRLSNKDLREELKSFREHLVDLANEISHVRGQLFLALHRQPPEQNPQPSP